MEVKQSFIFNNLLIWIQINSWTVNGNVMSCRDNIYFSDYISIPILKMEFTYLIYI